MKRVLAIVALILLGSASGRAGADFLHVFSEWYDDDIADIIQNVKDVKTKVTTGDIPQSAADLKRQLDLLRSQGVFITETVPEILEWLNRRRTPLRDFLRTPASDYSCEPGSGSTCAGFRENLKGFAQDFASLRSRFPAIDRLGLGDGAFTVGLLEKLPGFVLFGAYEILSRVPDWQYIPGDLADIYDEIGDPDAFSIEWRDAGTARTSAMSTVGMRAVALATDTPTGKFCDKHSDRVDNPLDAVRLNRIHLGAAVLASIPAIVAEFMPDQVQISILGEGMGSAKWPWGAFLKGVSSTINLIVAAFDTYRANLDVCRNRLAQIEADLASCPPLVAYKRQAANDEAYAFASKKIDESTILLPVSTARGHLDHAARLRRQYRYPEAYPYICQAYQTIGQ